MVFGESATCGGRWCISDQKRYGSKLLSTAPNSHAHSTSYLIVASGHPQVIRPCLDPKEISVNGHTLVVETSAHSINRRHGIPGRGDRAVRPRKIHTQSDIEGTQVEIFRRDG
jgi:hypothetical protein